MNSFWLTSFVVMTVFVLVMPSNFVFTLLNALLNEALDDYK